MTAGFLDLREFRFLSFSLLYYEWRIFGEEIRKIDGKLESTYIA